MIKRDNLYLYITFLVAIMSGWGVYTYAQTIASDSVVFISPYKTNKKQSDTPQISAPLLNSVIKSPVTIKGSVSGSWFFEGSFTVEIKDDNQTLLGKGPVVANDDWMTSSRVPFEGVIPFSNPTTKNGVIEFIKEDPSGLGKKVSYFLKISFDNKQLSDCEIGGCSNNVCSDGPNTSSTCEWSDEYTCYKEALCERQKTGLCGWTETPAFKACVNDIRAKHNNGML